MSFNALYKRLFLLCLVLAPFIWLVFTDDGRRRTDLVMIALLTDREPMHIAFAKLADTATEADFRTDFPAVPLLCQDRPGHFGDRVCAAPIAAVGGAPASAIELYFLDHRLNALQLTYLGAHHAYLLGQLNWELGPPEEAGDAAQSQGIRRWNTDQGQVLVRVTPATSHAEDEPRPTLLWLSNRYLRSRTPAANRASDAPDRPLSAGHRHHLGERNG